jgi:hypothetical protein
MKAAEFAKTTLIDGLLFILPLYICLLLLAKLLWDYLPS